MKLWTSMRKCVIPLAVCVPEEGEEPAKTESEQPASTGETTAGEAEAGTKEEISDVHALAVHGLWQAICRKHIFLYGWDCITTCLFRHGSVLQLRHCMFVARMFSVLLRLQQNSPVQTLFLPEVADLHVCRKCSCSFFYNGTGETSGGMRQATSVSMTLDRKARKRSAQ
jgi:hypothetical protein